jgi:translation initiation factor IF-2
MDRRLVKVAKEFNVGTTTIVEHLHKKGFDIENKPIAIVTDEMFTELQKEYQKELADKGEADKLMLGARPNTVRKEISEITVKKDMSFSLFGEPAAEEPKKEEKKPEAEIVDSKVTLQGPTVLGKIDLNAVNNPNSKPVIESKPIVKEEPKPKIEETPKTEEVAKVRVESELKTPISVPAISEEVPVVKESNEPELIAGNIPQLKGLKILGKVDTDKFKRDGRSATKSDPKAGQSNNPNSAELRKRKRKKVQVSNAPLSANQLKTGLGTLLNNDPKTASNNTNQQGQGTGNTNRPTNTGGNSNFRPGGNNTGGNSNYRPGGNTGGNSNYRPGGATGGGGFRPQTNEVKEVSKKDIDDKIKATMARLNFGGKNKGQKIRRDKRDKNREKMEMQELERLDQKIQVTEFITVSELASVLDVPVSKVITLCMNIGIIVSINQRLDAEVIEIIASEIGKDIEFITVEEKTDEEMLEEADKPEDLKSRAPIVTVMGHVDHGKTSLLDFIRKTNVASGEAGGITQHIGAYEVKVNGKKITFLDTPGHEAFTAMRARGAKVTDVAVIIIAADDNVMPQTKEAISHAQAAGVPIVFAINKVDKAGANPGKIKEELSAMNLLVEEWGGKYQSGDISAKSGLGIEELLEKILLEAEVLELTANPDKNATGTIIEASLDKGKGYVCKILVQAGTLKVGDAVVAGEYSGKIKAMYNELGAKVTKVGPSTPVLILGLGGAPTAGEKFKVMDNESDARQLASKRLIISREQANRASKRISLDEIGRRLALGTFKELNLIVKGDVDGSVEALADALLKQTHENVQVNIIHKAVGQIIESDVLLASASDAIIIGFQVRPSVAARKLAEKEGVEIKMYSIIYEAIEEIRSAIEGMLEPTKEEKILGLVEVREVYKISKIGTVAGCYVSEGKIARNNFIRVIRDGIVVFPTKEGVIGGELSSLKRFKEDMKEVKNQFECGITIKNFNDIKEGDTIEAFEIIEIKQKLK